jgi:AbiV family abortive infection protein
MKRSSTDPLPRYKGFLTPSQAAAGINAAVSNAHSLAEDASLLLHAGRFASAASLAVLSIEESGKVSVIRGLALCTTPECLAGEWKRFRRHQAKNYLGLLPDLVLRGARKLGDFRGLFTTETDCEREALDSVKQVGFYTDCLGSAHWSIPAEAASEQLASSLVGLAVTLSHPHQVTERELELWVEHMRPWPTSLDVMKASLARWADAMVQARLMKPGHAKGFGEFLED